MAWRLNKSVVRGEIDNRSRGIVTGEFWLVGRKEPVKLSLAGNCLRDIAGCRLSFENPSPEAGDHVDLMAEQEGTVGDITASRKVRVFEVPTEQAIAMKRAGQDVPEHLGNSLYLEWFSDLNGRVVVESSDFRFRISEPQWRMSKEEEKEQSQSNHQTIREWMKDLSMVSPPDDDAYYQMDEFEWEKSLKESDRIADKYSALLDKYMDHPDRDRIIAREMGWTWMEEALDADEFDDSDDDPEEMEELSSLEPNPATEGVDWIRTRNGRITHPLSAKSFETAMTMWHHCKKHKLLGEEGDEDLHEMIFKAQTLSAKLAGALDSLAYDDDRDGGFIVACLKRALKFFEAAISGTDKVQKKNIVEPKRLEAFRRELFVIREEMLRLMKFYRQKQW